MYKPNFLFFFILSILFAQVGFPQTSLAQEKTTPVQSGKQKKISTASPVSTEAKPIRDKWAVVIGIDRFKDKSIPQLKYSAKDAKDFANFLVEKGNFAKDHVKLLTNEQATERNILNIVGDKWLPRRALPNDLIVIFISSHGSPKELDRRGANYLVAHDTLKDELYTSGIKLEDLGPDIQDRTQCNRVVLLLDACNSGAAKAGGKGLYRSQNFNVAEISQKAGEGLVVISSSDANQKSWESTRYKNSVFTKQLIATLSDEEKNTRIENVYSDLKEKVEQEVKFDRKVLQTPVMSSKWRGLPLKVTCKPAKPRTIPDSEDEKLRIPVGTTSNTVKVSTTDSNAEANIDGKKLSMLNPSPEKHFPQATKSVRKPGADRIAIVGVIPANDFVLKQASTRRQRFKRKRQRRRFLQEKKEANGFLVKVLHQELARKLMLKTKRRIVPQEMVILNTRQIFRNKRPNFFFIDRKRFQQLGQTIKANNLIYVQITNMKINEQPGFGPQYKIQVTTKLIDGTTGKQKAVFRETIAKPPKRAGIPKEAIAKLVLPELAEKIASDVASKL